MDKIAPSLICDQASADIPSNPTAATAANRRAFIPFSLLADWPASAERTGETDFRGGFALRQALVKQLGGEVFRPWVRKPSAYQSRPRAVSSISGITVAQRSTILPAEIRQRTKP
jgi:hypothetical protein